MAVVVVGGEATSNITSNVVCYYASWAQYRQGAASYPAEEVPVELCTHVVFAFAVLDGATLTAAPHDPQQDPDHYRRFLALRSRNPEAKMLLGLGGWNDSRGDKYSRLVSQPARRAAFTAHVVGFLQRYGFDGLDLDWEYPTTAEDKRGFRLWVEELRAAFSPHGLLLTAAVSAGRSAIDQGYDVPAVAKALDLIHLMAYDFHGSWEGQVAHHAPLFPEPGQNPQFCTDFAVRHWIKKGAPAAKLVLGVPAYGRSWTLAGSDASVGAAASGAGKPGPLVGEAGVLAYYEVCQAQAAGGRKVPGGGGPHLTRGDQWVGYDDVDAVTRKAQYARQKALGGVMIWEVTMDDFRGSCGGGVNPLLTAVSRVLGGPALRPEASTSSPTPHPPPQPPVGSKQPALQQCRRTGYTPDPSSCRHFFRCDGTKVFRFQCPNGLHWCQRCTACEWPGSARCMG